MNVWDFVPEFAAALIEHLKVDAKRWAIKGEGGADTWLKRTRKGQEDREIEATEKRFTDYKENGQPLDYLSIAGDALINWIRERHPEIWKE